MELKELMAAFAAEAGAEGCAPDEKGAYNLEIDGIEMMIRPVGDGTLVVTYADLGEPPEEGREQLYRAMLEASFPAAGTATAALSIDNRTGRICLHRIESLAAADYAAFRASIEAFVNVADGWRRQLASFPSTFSLVKDVVDKAEAESRSMTLNGFIQV